MKKVKLFDEEKMIIEREQNTHAIDEKFCDIYYYYQNYFMAM